MIAKAKARAAKGKAWGWAKRRGETTLRQTIGPDESFEKLAQQLIEACDKVECSKDDYIAGLRYILGEVEISLQAAKETVDRYE